MTRRLLGTACAAGLQTICAAFDQWIMLLVCAEIPGRGIEVPLIQGQLIKFGDGGLVFFKHILAAHVIHPTLGVPLKARLASVRDALELAEERSHHFDIRQTRIEALDLVAAEGKDGGEMLIEDLAVLSSRVVKDHRDTAEPKNGPNDLYLHLVARDRSGALEDRVNAVRRPKSRWIRERSRSCRPLQRL